MHVFILNAMLIYLIWIDVFDTYSLTDNENMLLRVIQVLILSQLLLILDAKAQNKRLTTEIEKLKVKTAFKNKKL